MRWAGRSTRGGRDTLSPLLSSRAWNCVKARELECQSLAQNNIEDWEREKTKKSWAKHEKRRLFFVLACVAESANPLFDTGPENKNSHTVTTTTGVGRGREEGSLGFYYACEWNKVRTGKWWKGNERDWNQLGCKKRLCHLPNKSFFSSSKVMLLCGNGAC